MPDRLPIDATTGDVRHRDVRAEVFAAVPQQRASIGKRAFWRIVLFVARFPAGLRLLKRIRGS
ncbi:MAG TPA: hypothetical protein VIV63_17160 [Steroidobacteraceae bacterium]